jgi:hypothetical protein
LAFDEKRHQSPAWLWDKGAIRSNIHLIVEGASSRDDKKMDWEDSWVYLEDKLIDLKGGNGYEEGAFEKLRRLNKAGQVADSKGNMADIVKEVEENEVEDPTF